MVKKAENIIVGISIGDLNGIGSEVILKTFEDTRMLELCTPVIFANVKIVSFLKKELKLDVAIHGIDKVEQLVVGKINVLNVWREGVNLEFGKNDDVVGSYAIKSFVAATKALKEGLVDVLVTAPINKYNIQSEEFKFPGHTDYLDKELEGDALMLMVHDDLRVGLLTDHVPVNEVAKHLNEKLISSKIKTIIQTLKQDFEIEKPKVAVLGLNPHSGDNGVIGQEEEKIISQDYFFDAQGRFPRYYQQIAINRTVEAIAKGQNRILLVMATGTGKTYTAFQIIHRLWKSGAKKRILFLA